MIADISGRMPLVVLRADAGPAIGAGHVMRCLALARTFAAGGWRTGFAASRETFASVRALAKEPVESLELSPIERFRQDDERELALAMGQRWPEGADILVVDHYGHGAVLERACRGWANRVVVIDDLADRPHEGDVLVDVANPAVAYHGLAPPWCKVLTGASYAIVDAAFRRIREESLVRRDAGPVERVLVCFGQMDPPNATRFALDALAAAGFSGEVDVVLGGAAPHLASVRAAAGPRVRLHVDTEEMPTLMRDADLAIGAGGVTALERCGLGLPSVLVTLADNQRRIASMLAQVGAAIDAGQVDTAAIVRLADVLRSLWPDGARRKAMARAGAVLVDGRGAERIMLAAIGPARAKSGVDVELRLATDDDEAWLFALQSKAETRKYASNPDLPTREGHRNWFRQTLADPARLLMIAEAGGMPAAMLRLDQRDGAQRISIAVDPDYHRQGIATAVLSLAARLRPSTTLEAQVLPGNAASHALFSRAGYRPAGEDLLVRQSPAV